MDAFYIPPGSVAAPMAGQPSVGEATVPSGGNVIAWTSSSESVRPLINLARDWHPTAALTPSVAAPPNGMTSTRRYRVLARIAMAAVVVLLLAGAGYAAVTFATYQHNKPAPTRASAVAVSTPTPSHMPTSTPMATPAASPTPSPIPSATPTTVSAPAAKPTTGHPQQVKVQAVHGLWLRSSPTSVNNSNIIGWMPDGAEVSVDSAGSYWWHGSYDGKAGYFASSFTD